ncbi:MAG TPA: radical SAM protein [Deltaproteobacteria bacterium]|nr:radical SAM protein [Deltaproteobacteria bacterium]HOI06419.1 radical SAM protein [Deltaproteobacteria bacterium]
MWAKPLGLLGMGAVLKANGCRVSYIDCLRAPHPRMRESAPRTRPGGHGKYYRQIVKTPEVIGDIPRSYARYGISIDAFKSDLLGIERPDIILVTSLMTYWYPGVFEAIRILKEVFPGVPVVLGGIYAALCRGHALRYSGADHVVSHGGEAAALSFLAGLLGIRPARIPDEGDLDSLPYPLFDLVDPLRYIVLQTSRGCPHRCSYCASHILSPGMLRRDPIKVVDEIEHWSTSRGAAHVAFYDDALLFQAEKLALPIMREVARRGLEVRFHCPNALHARWLSREMALAMRESGFSTIRLGLETADPGRQVKTGGKVTNRDFLQAVDHLFRAGFHPEEVGAYILCGLPGQRAQEVMDAVSFVKGAGVRPIIAEYSPLPGTADWEEACRSSRYPLAEDPLYQNNTLLPCAWEGLTFEDYRDIRKEASFSPRSP